MPSNHPQHPQWTFSFSLSFTAFFPPWRESVVSECEEFKRAFSLSVMAIATIRISSPRLFYVLHWFFDTLSLAHKKIWTPTCALLSLPFFMKNKYKYIYSSPHPYVMCGESKDSSLLILSLFLKFKHTQKIHRRCCFLSFFSSFPPTAFHQHLDVIANPSE